MKKRILSVVLSISVIVAIFSVGGVAVNAGNPVTIPETGVTGTYDLAEGSVVIASDGTYVIKQEGSGITRNTVTLNSNCTVFLDGVNIEVENPDNIEDYSKPNPVNVNGPYTVNLYLVDGTSNTLASEDGEFTDSYNSVRCGSGRAGIHVPSGASLNIRGNTGRLYSTGAQGHNLQDSVAHAGGGAGIGGNGGYSISSTYSAEASGTVNIYGGLITATGGATMGHHGSGGIGIGGGGAHLYGYDGASGEVNINGGTVKATGGNGTTDESSHHNGFVRGVGGDLAVYGGTLIAKAATQGRSIRSAIAEQPTLSSLYKWRIEDNGEYTLSSSTPYLYAADQKYVEITAQADLTDYNKALAAVVESYYTTDSWSTYQSVVDSNVVTTENTQGDVDAATLAIKTAQANLVIKVDEALAADKEAAAETPESPKTGDGATGYALLIGIMALMGMVVISKKEYNK